MTAYPYASPVKIQSSLDAIGSRFVGSQEVTLWKQILIAIGNGGINPPFPTQNAYLTPDEDFYYTTPDGSQYYQQPV